MNPMRRLDPYWIVIIVGVFTTLIVFIFTNKNEPVEYNQPDHDKIETVSNDTSVFSDKSNKMHVIIEKPK